MLFLRIPRPARFELKPFDETVGIGFERLGCINVPSDNAADIIQGVTKVSHGQHRLFRSRARHSPADGLALLSAGLGWVESKPKWSDPIQQPVKS